MSRVCGRPLWLVAASGVNKLSVNHESVVRKGKRAVLSSGIA